MHPLLIVFMILVIFGAGIYIGVSDLVGQYGVDTSSGSASGVACAPEQNSAAINRPTRFAASGVPSGAKYHWATDEGTAQVNLNGSLSVLFDQPGEKDVLLFWKEGARWHTTTCGVLVR